MARSLNSYIRSMRRRVHLSQAELAFLVGKGNKASASKHELDQRIPSLVTAFGYSAVLGCDPRELFAGRYEEIEHGVRRRAKILHRRLSTGPRTAERTAKLDHLERIISAGGRRAR